MLSIWRMGSASTYLLHLEAVNLLLVTCSSQLYTPLTAAPPGTHPFTEALLQQRDLAVPAVESLLRRWVGRPPLPARAPLALPTRGRGVMRFVRRAAGEAPGVERLGSLWQTGVWVAWAADMQVAWL